MKKTLVIVSLLFATLTTVAQEKYSFAVNVGLGVAENVNHSPLSLFSDAQDEYTSFYRSLQVGMRNSKQYFGLQAGYNILNTSNVAIGERLSNVDVLLLYRRYFPVRDRFEVPVGVSLGCRFSENSFNRYGTEETRDRTALLLGVETGLMFKLSESMRIGFRYVYGLQYMYMNTVDDLPAGMQPNSSKGVIDEHCLMLDLGFTL